MKTKAEDLGGVFGTSVQLWEKVELMRIFKKKVSRPNVMSNGYYDQILKKKKRKKGNIVGHLEWEKIKETFNNVVRKSDRTEDTFFYLCIRIRIKDVLLYRLHDSWWMGILSESSEPCRCCGEPRRCGFYSASARVVTTWRAGNPPTGGGLPVSREY